MLAAPDKFKGTLSAADAAAAIGHACWELGLDCVERPMADGGDGLVEVLGGATRTSTVTGPLGDPVEAEWRLAGDTAVIEMAAASGLVLAGGAAGNRPLDATTTGTGELIDLALDAGARRIIVGLGGSATTDGGFGALRAIHTPARLKAVELLVACDVETVFADAPSVFGPQKGASTSQITMLERRLDRLAQMYAEEFDVDVANLAGGGAAGGLGAALAVLGGRLLPGVELVAEEVGIFDLLDPNVHPADRIDLVVTGEGKLDPTSFDGKVVGGIAEIAADVDVPVAAVAGEIDGLDELTRDERHLRQVEVTGRPELLAAASLVSDHGAEAAMDEPMRCIERSTSTMLQRLLDPD